MSPSLEGATVFAPQPDRRPSWNSLPALFIANRGTREGSLSRRPFKLRDDQVAARAVVMQDKMQRPMQFEITPATGDVVQATTPRTWRAGRPAAATFSTPD